MKTQVLDCTLRDGAYVVESDFGESRIRNIISALVKAKVDIVECGWLRNSKPQEGSVAFNSPLDAEKYLVDGTKYAMMFDFGKYDLANLPSRAGRVEIIRMSFYKRNLYDILPAIKTVQECGYQIYLQPSNIKEYAKEDVLELIKIANCAKVDALYIVDSFGSMFPNELEILMENFAQNVDPQIKIGFHSHNNIQLSFGLSIEFLTKMKRDIIVDSTLCGIGRGAGNTKTELILSYLKRYDLEPIWDVISKEIEPIKSIKNWEYSVKTAQKGLRNMHPNS